MFTDQYSATRRAQHFHAPQDLDGAAELLAEHRGDVRLSAGSTYLMLMAAHGEGMPSHLVSLHRIAGLDTIDEGVLGALVTLRKLERGALTGPQRAVTMAAAVVGGPSVRTLGTLGGNIGFSDGDLAPALMALDATVHLHGGETMPVSQFVTAKPPNAIVTHVTHGLREADGWSGATVKLKRRAMDWPVVTVSAQLKHGEGGEILDCRVAAQALAAEPIELPAVSAVLVGSLGEPEALDYAAEAATHRVDVRSDAEATAAYRRAVAPAVVRKALELARDLSPDQAVDIREAHR